ncbi:DUF1622 domain-containing protein [Micromonospora sp. STR1s_5]|nr:DUF1622 domain-containing protein [Micromonospora sp. STR1s_5]
MTEQAHQIVDQLAKYIELAGVAIILGGIVLASFLFVREGARTGAWRAAYDAYRSNLGRGILLGLELLGPRALPAPPRSVPATPDRIIDELVSDDDIALIQDLEAVAFER